MFGGDTFEHVAQQRIGQLRNGRLVRQFGTQCTPIVALLLLHR
jgi:hypothetical protein